MNIIHLPYNHGNFVSALQGAERKLGANTKLAASPNPFVQLPDISLSGSRWHKPRTLNTYRLARNCDVVAFNFGSSIYDTSSRRQFLLDLPFYPKRQKKMMFYQGSDARIHYGETIAKSREYEISRGISLKDTTNDGYISQAEVDLKRRRAQKVDKYVERIFYFNPDLSLGLPGRAKFFPYPFFSNVNMPPVAQDIDRPLRVLHLSTNRVLKGTGLIEQALMVANKSMVFDYKVKVRVPRKEAQRAMEWADVLIDQVGLGWYGMQAVEALSMGKVVLCSIDRREWVKHLPDYVDKDSGILNCSHIEIPNVLSELIEKPDRLRNLQLSGPRFVKDIHDPIKLVKAFYGDWIDGQR